MFLLISCFFYSLIIFESFVSVDTRTIFWDDASNDDMLRLIHGIEGLLKFYIYPIPDHVIEHEDVSRDNDLMHHFRADSNNDNPWGFSSPLNVSMSKDDHRKFMVVTNPDEANVFIIDHHGIYVHESKNHHCEDVHRKHLNPIIHNVIYNNPYFNRSGGFDHVFFSMYDRGALCEPHCDKDEKITEINLIKNAIFIGNYGMDKQKFNTSFNCHRTGHDIVIPQLFQEKSLKIFHKFYGAMLPNRTYHSSFAGSTWGERFPILSMHEERIIDFDHGAELFTYDNFPHGELKGFSYFMYAPCGLACWSQRLYEAFLYFTIPVIVSDGAIQAFERFIDWRRISIKMNLTTWFTENLRLEYRKQMRFASDDYSTKLNRCWDSVNYNIDDRSVVNIDVWSVFLKDPDRDSSWTSSKTIECLEFFETDIWRKRLAIRESVPWFDFNHLDQSIHAFKLLEFEIWCRIRRLGKNSDLEDVNWEPKIDNFCTRPADFSSRLQYFTD